MEVRLLNARNKDALLPWLSVRDLSALFGTCRYLRQTVLELNQQDESPLSVTYAAASVQDKFLTCIDFGRQEDFQQLAKQFYDEFQTVWNEADTELKEREISKPFFDIYFAAASYATRTGKVEYLEDVWDEMFETYDWEFSNYNDYSFKLLEMGVQWSHPSIVEYILQAPIDNNTPESNPALWDMLIEKGFDAASKYRNIPAARCFLSRGVYITVYKLVKLNDNDLFDKYIEDASLKHWIYEWDSEIKPCLDLAIVNQNQYILGRLIQIATDYDGGFLDQMRQYIAINFPSPSFFASTFLQRLMNNKVGISVMIEQLPENVVVSGTWILDDWFVGQTLINYMRDRSRARRLVDVCLDFVGTGRNDSSLGNSLLWILRHDSRDPAVKAKSCAYLYALRRMLVKHPQRDDPEMTNELLEIPFPMQTLVGTFRLDHPTNQTYNDVVAKLLDPNNKHYTEADREILGDYL